MRTAACRNSDGGHRQHVAARTNAGANPLPAAEALEESSRLAGAPPVASFCCVTHPSLENQGNSDAAALGGRPSLPDPRQVILNWTTGCRIKSIFGNVSFLPF